MGTRYAMPVLMKVWWQKKYWGKKWFLEAWAWLRIMRELNSWVWWQWAINRYFTTCISISGTCDCGRTKRKSEEIIHFYLIFLWLLSIYLSAWVDPLHVNGFCVVCLCVYWLLCACFRLYEWHGTTPAWVDPLPDWLPGWQEGSGPIHHLLDSVTLRTLGCHAASSPVPQTSHGRGEYHTKCTSKLCKKWVLLVPQKWQKFGVLQIRSCHFDKI